MKRLIAVAAIFLAAGGLLASPTARASEFKQRGSQGESRTLTGLVLSGQNQPLQKAIVYLKNTKTLAIKTYISEADGSYRFPGLASNVDYEVYAEHEGARSDIKTLSGFDSRKEANITLKIHAK
jgi:hypothetical protein